MFNKVKELIDDTKNYYGIGITQTFDKFSISLNSLFVDRDFFDENFFDDFEEKLIELDVLPILAITLKDKLELKIYNSRINKKTFTNAIYDVIDEIVDFKINNELKLDKDELTILLITGVNGVGKTTTISKLINKYKNDYNLEVVAADTFRAGAIKQLEIWANSQDVPITKTHEGHSPSAVIYDGLVSANENKRNLLICDTAGRLHNKENLMLEMNKISKVIEKYSDNNKKVSQKNILILDGTAGKNTLNQAREFNESINIDGFILTKMDTNAKAGICLNIAYEFNKPIYYITEGEKIDQIKEFDYKEYLKLIIGE